MSYVFLTLICEFIISQNVWISLDLFFGIKETYIFGSGSPSMIGPWINTIVSSHYNLGGENEPLISLNVVTKFWTLPTQIWYPSLQDNFRTLTMCSFRKYETQFSLNTHFSEGAFRVGCLLYDSTCCWLASLSTCAPVLIGRLTVPSDPRQLMNYCTWNALLYLSVSVYHSVTDRGHTHPSRLLRGWGEWMLKSANYDKQHLTEANTY